MNKYKLKFVNNQGKEIEILYKKKSKIKTGILVFIIDLIAVVFFSWWWFGITIIFTTMFSIKTYESIEEKRKEVDFFLNHQYFPKTQNDLILLNKDFHYDWKVITELAIKLERYNKYIFNLLNYKIVL